MTEILTAIVYTFFAACGFLFCTAALVYVERKVMGSIQLRTGPSVVGPFGIMQPVADAIKCICKENIIPRNADKLMFIIAPMLTFTSTMAICALIPISSTLCIADLDLGLLYFIVASSFSIYGIMLSGWSCNSKYGVMGSARSVAQLISYELTMITCIHCVGMMAESLNLRDIVIAQRDHYFGLTLFPVFIVFFISCIAESKRPPFDLPEAEAELVSGYHVEYSSTPFIMFFIAEYLTVLIGAMLSTVLFLGGWLPIIELDILSWVPGVFWFAIKVSLLLYLFIAIKSALPRYRYDQLMRLGWCILLPVSLLCLVIEAFVIIF